MQRLDRADEIGGDLTDFLKVEETDHIELLKKMLDGLQSTGDAEVIAAVVALEQRLTWRASQAVPMRRFTAQLKRLDDKQLVGPSVMSLDLPLLKNFVYNFPESYVEEFIRGLLAGAAFSMDHLSSEETQQAQLPGKVEFLSNMLEFVQHFALLRRPLP